MLLELGKQEKLLFASLALVPLELTGHVAGGLVEQEPLGAGEDHGAEHATGADLTVLLDAVQGI